MGLGKKKRFEIFMRDGFTCQYCGRKAPEVVLEVDHAIPQCRSSAFWKALIESDRNLVTSCRDCNRGKSDMSLEGPRKYKIQWATIESASVAYEAVCDLCEFLGGVWGQENPFPEPTFSQMNAIADYFCDMAAKEGDRMALCHLEDRRKSGEARVQ